MEILRPDGIFTGHLSHTTVNYFSPFDLISIKYFLQFIYVNFYFISISYRTSSNVSRLNNEEEDGDELDPAVVLDENAGEHVNEEGNQLNLILTDFVYFIDISIVNIY